MKKHKLSYRILLVAVICTLLISGCSFSGTSNNSSVSEQNQEPVYIDVETTNEFLLSAPEKTSTLININQEGYEGFVDFLNSQAPEFTYSNYYGLEEALELYDNPLKSSKSGLLNSQGLLDSDKLLAMVNKNNKKEWENGKNTMNTFYSETDEKDKKEICNLIAKVVNDVCSAEDVAKMGNTLSAMKLFNKTGSASNAYITNSLVFVYNPTMSGMYADTQNIATGESEEKMIQSVLVHEIMHLIQHKNDDLNDDNGVEVGMCRLYNVDSYNKKIPVDSLWTSWILEAAAEMAMADYLEMDTHTYAKKISYANSFNLSNFAGLSENKLLESLAFSGTHQEIFKLLGLDSPESQKQFLEFMYSVEIIQYDPQEFWDNYCAITGENPSEEEKLKIRMEIRSEIVRYLTYNFYLNLASSIKDGTISDSETVFYLMRLWEIDCFGHLEYSKFDSLESATSFILWHHEVQNSLFNKIAVSPEEYDNYCMQISGDATILNCNFNGFNNFAKSYIIEAKENLNTGRFVRNSHMIQYLQSSSINSPS